MAWKIIDSEYPPDSLYSLWYYPDLNRFADEDGTIIHNLSDKFDVWQLDEWKRTEEYGLLQDKNGDLCELFYPEDGEDWPVTTLYLTNSIRRAFDYLRTSRKE